MRHAFNIVLIAAFSLLPIGAYAQDTGSLIRKAPAQIPSGTLDNADRARLAMYRYAECVVGRWPKRIDSYLLTFPGSKDAHSAANRLSSDECLSSGEMKFNEPLFRASVYDFMYKSRYKKNGPLNFTAVAPIDYSRGRMDEFGGADTQIALRNIAECTVRKSPEDARQLAISMVVSRAESKAFDGLIPHMSSCVTKDVTLKFSKSIFRGVLGEVLYRLSIAATVTQTPVKDK
jgi:hypothetical protein